MKNERPLIREFLEKVEWATPENISYLLHGESSRELNIKTGSTLFQMATRKVNGAIKKLPNHKYAVYADPQSKKKDKGTHNLDHDIKLRNVLGKFLHGKSIDGLSLKPPADATLRNIYFEMDNGHMNNGQLIEKIETHYKGKGQFRVIFIMADRYDKPHLEEERLKKLFEILEKVMHHKPNRILGACYTKFLSDGKLYNLRGEECATL